MPSREIEIVGRLHTDIFNFPSHILPGVRMQITLKKARRELYLMSKAEDSKAAFMFLNAQLLVKRVRPSPVYLIAQIMALEAGAIGK